MSGDFLASKDTMTPKPCSSKASTRGDGDPMMATGISMTTGGVADEETKLGCSSTSSHATEKISCGSATTTSHGSSIAREKLSKAT
jgi:hypothetical protein